MALLLLVFHYYQLPISSSTHIYIHASPPLNPSVTTITHKHTCKPVLSTPIHLPFCLKFSRHTMGFRLSGVVQAKKLLRRSLSGSGSRPAADVPKGYFAVYVGENKTRFVVPVAYLNQPAFQELLSHAEEEYGFDHPNGGLTIPCSEDEFSQLASQLN
uniref:Uncharacterized protein n=1 Tax=Kalanchoe fedtschenkoi TaxID=63787 RepID=A0A7N0T3K0_KALFE